MEFRPILKALVEQVSLQLRLATELKHPGESGRAREQIISNFLAGIIPEEFAVSTGFVIDARGNVSKQVDIVVFRRGYHPVFRIGDIPVFMIESVVAGIEVKAQITSESVLSSALKNLGSIRELDRTNAGNNYLLNGRQAVGPVSDSYANRVFTAVIAEESLSKENLVKRLLEYLRSTPRRL